MLGAAVGSELTGEPLGGGAGVALDAFDAFKATTWAAGAGDVFIGAADGFDVVTSGAVPIWSVRELFSSNGQPIEKLVMPNVTRNDPNRMFAR